MAFEVLLRASVNLFSLTSELLQGHRISSDHCNNIVVNTTCGNTILDHHIKTHDGWVTRVEFLHEFNNERKQSATAPPKKNINYLHIELKHTSKTITCATTEALNIQVTSTFKPCKDCTLGKASNVQSSKRLYLVRKFWGKGFF